MVKKVIVSQPTEPKPHPTSLVTLITKEGKETNINYATWVKYLRNDTAKPDGFAEPDKAKFTVKKKPNPKLLTKQ